MKDHSKSHVVPSPKPASTIILVSFEVNMRVEYIVITVGSIIPYSYTTFPSYSLSTWVNHEMSSNSLRGRLGYT